MPDSLRVVNTSPDIVHSDITPDETLHSLHPVLARVFANRGITTIEELDYSLSGILSPVCIESIIPAVNLLFSALKRQDRILVVGDFDADGATSTALAVRCLCDFGFNSVDFLIPSRLDDGYGLTGALAEKIVASGNTDLVVTVDNGVSCLSAADILYENNIRLLVTDHHLADDVLPRADAIVDPKICDDDFGKLHLAGVGVVFYLMMAFRTYLREQGWFDRSIRSEPNIARYLDLVAFGTIADIVPLDQVNRILVAQGVARIRAGEACPGIRALVRLAGRDEKKLVTSDLAFFLGPRLNAAGRLGDMSVGVRCLLSDTEAEARRFVSELEQLNNERKQIEATMFEQAVSHFDSLDVCVQDAMKNGGITLYDASWHVGVIGILASRIKALFNRPCVIFAPSGDSVLRGSSRSPEGFNIRDVLEEVDARYPDLLLRYGGHSQAAGLAIHQGSLAVFSRAFYEVIAEQFQTVLIPPIVSDGPLSASDITLEVSKLVKYSAPWGQNFEEPLFDNEFEVLEVKVIASVHQRVLIRLADSDENYTGIWFNSLMHMPLSSGEQVRFLYSLDINSFRNTEKVQLLIRFCIK